MPEFAGRAARDLSAFPFRAKREPDAALPLPPVRQIAGHLGIDAYASSVTGKRLVNEDSFLCLIDPSAPGWMSGLFVIADGIGGKQNGHIASSVAVKTVREIITATDRFYTPKAVHELIGEAFESADKAVHVASEADPKLDEMGTTLIIGVVAQRRLFWTSLGDSRVYLHRGRRLVQLTTDDWVRSLGDVSCKDEPELAGQTVTLVSQAVGWGGVPCPEIQEIELGADDIVLLCSDGLTEGVVDKQIEDSLHRHHRRLDLVARRLLDLASCHPDADNTTLILARLDRR